LTQGLDPDQLPFTGSLRIVRRQLVSHQPFSPDEIATACRLAATEILTERLPARRLRAFPRAVKRKVSNYQLKRARHRGWPQPARPDAEAAVILPRGLTDRHWA
jgi:hypothetical protein